MRLSERRPIFPGVRAGKGEVTLSAWWRNYREYVPKDDSDIDKPY